MLLAAIFFRRNSRAQDMDTNSRSDGRGPNKNILPTEVATKNKTTRTPQRPIRNSVLATIVRMPIPLFARSAEMARARTKSAEARLMMRIVIGRCSFVMVASAWVRIQHPIAAVPQIRATINNAVWRILTDGLRPKFRFNGRNEKSTPKCCEKGPRQTLVGLDITFRQTSYDEPLIRSAERSSGRRAWRGVRGYSRRAARLLRVAASRRRTLAGR